jgi:hypothetical protein
MARTQGKGWFRTRKQSKGEFVLFCYYSQDPATGERKERFHKLGLVSQFPDEARRWTQGPRIPDSRSSPPAREHRHHLEPWEKVTSTSVLGGLHHEYQIKDSAA